MAEMSQLKTTKLGKRDANKIPTLKIWGICHQPRFVFKQPLQHGWFHPKPQICLSQVLEGRLLSLLWLLPQSVQCRGAFVTGNQESAHVCYMGL